MFKTSKQLTAELESANSKIESLEEEVTELQSQAQTLTAELATAREELSAANQINTEAQADIEARDTAITDLNAKLEEQKQATEAAEKSAGAKASAEIANAGHPPVDVSQDTAPTIREQYAALPAGPERKAFRDKHLSQLI